MSRTTTRRGINKIPKCFFCPGNSKELSKNTKRSTYDSNEARTKPWLTRLPTSDNNSPMTKRIRSNETTNVSLTLAIVADCRRNQGGRNQGSSQLTELTSRTTNSKKGDKIPATIQNLRRRQERYRPKQTQQTLSGPFFYNDVGVA